LPKVDLVELVSPAISSVTEVPVDHIASAVQPAVGDAQQVIFGDTRSGIDAAPAIAVAFHAGAIPD